MSKEELMEDPMPTVKWVSKEELLKMYPPKIMQRYAEDLSENEKGERALREFHNAMGKMEALRVDAGNTTIGQLLNIVMEISDVYSKAKPYLQGDSQ